MRVLVDTTVWSAALRRTKRGEAETAAAAELAELIREGRAELVGPIRQEILSGIRDTAQFDRLRNALAAFSDTPIEPSDYEAAAAAFNSCTAPGIQGSGVDLLLCAVATRHAMAIYTTHRDFERYARVLPLRLHTPRGLRPPTS